MGRDKEKEGQGFTGANLSRVAMRVSVGESEQMLL